MLEAVGVWCLLPVIEWSAFFVGWGKMCWSRQFELDGDQFACEVESRVGDEPLSLVSVDVIEMNRCLLRFYF
ncbi:MAG TPA: hypothetical protein DD423_02140 [Opitutae bacterium]|jgi:hypothetical protein|nr:hypothetical protein [Opitutae bacterium]